MRRKLSLVYVDTRQKALDLKSKEAIEPGEPVGVLEGLAGGFLLFLHGLRYQIFNVGTIVMVFLACLSTLASAKGVLDLEWSVSMRIVAYGCIMPSVITIQAANGCRNKAFDAAADIKSNMFSVWSIFKGFCTDAGLNSNDVEDDIQRLLGDILTYLRSKDDATQNSEPKLAHAVYDGFKKLHGRVRQLKTLPKPPPPPELTSLSNFLRIGLVSFEQARTYSDYRTPRGLRLFCFVIVHISPIFLSPYFNSYCDRQNDSDSQHPHTYGCKSGYLMAVLFVIINSALLSVQEGLENPYDGDGEDDIDWSIWTDQLDSLSKYGGDGGRGLSGTVPSPFKRALSDDKKKGRGGAKGSSFRF